MGRAWALRDQVSEKVVACWGGSPRNPVRSRSRLTPWTTSESSGTSSWASPAGLKETAVASSATAMKAPPVPAARAPAPWMVKPVRDCSASRAYGPGPVWARSGAAAAASHHALRKAASIRYSIRAM